MCANGGYLVKWKRERKVRRRALSREGNDRRLLRRTGRIGDLWSVETNTECCVLTSDLRWSLCCSASSCQWTECADSFCWLGPLQTSLGSSCLCLVVVLDLLTYNDHSLNELTFFHFDYYIHHLLNTSASFSSAVCYTCIFKATSLYSSESAPYFNLVSLNVLCCSNPGLPDTFFNF